jgi:hypothetical protein
MMNIHQALPRDLPLNLRELSDAIRAFNPDQEKPQKLDELWSLIRPVCNVIPELNRYDITSAEGRREFPRTACSIAILGCILRASDALKTLDAPAVEANRRVAAAESLMAEFYRFSGPQAPALRVSLDQFIGVVGLFRGISDDAHAVATIAVAVVYGDLCKMPQVKESLKKSINADIADHDIALNEAFKPENIRKCSDLFPTMFCLPAEYQRRIHSEVLSGLNLGHVLQAETCAAALTPLKRQTAQDPQGLTYWLLPTLLDILGARADGGSPETWSGSVLGNVNLVPALLLFARQLPELATDGEASFFDTFQSNLSRGRFYQPIFADPALTPRYQDTVFRLSRFFSWETDARPMAPLIEGFKNLSASEKELIAKYFLSTGLTPGEPKVVVPYLPYVFTQLYSKHLELPKAISYALDTMCSLLRRIEDEQRLNGEGERTGIRTYSAQEVWFNTLRLMSKEKLVDRPLNLALDEPQGGVPEVILEDSLLARNRSMREVALRCLKAATEIAVPYCAAILDRELSPLEREVLAFVNSHNFTDGSWYRPIHNLVVPYTMIHVCKREGANRDLVLAAMLHDIGYAGVKIPGTLEGAAWKTKDMRERHMAAGAVMSDQFLRQLISDGKVSLSHGRKDELIRIIATHDDPYIGGALEDREALLHRDADRAFVASGASFWKDYLAYLSDPKRASSFRDAGIELTPSVFLELRRASFGSQENNQMARFANLEPMTTEIGQAISEGQLSRRLGEIPSVMGAIRVGGERERELTKVLAQIIIDDFRALGAS